MRALRRFRRSARQPSERLLSVPTGWRRYFERQAFAGSMREIEQPTANLDEPIQISDPSSDDFGKILWMLGYDPIETLGI